jgi:LmbE family N-acetylglucosaminyl deacetylase
MLSCAVLALLFVLSAGCGGDSGTSDPTDALIVVSPHPDDESIFGAATIHRMAADPNRYVRAIYMSGGDRATAPGPCNGIPEDSKIQQIIELREHETRAAWKVIAPDREIPIDFLRGPDQRLVASSTLVAGRHVDVLSSDGARVVDEAVQIATQLPPSIQTVLFLTTAPYDAHPDHRTAYRAARQAAEILHDQQHLAVRIWSWIVHDEFSNPNLPICCLGDQHWPAPGSTDDYTALTDVPARPRPPLWNHVEDVRDLTALRHEALAQHVSQLVGYPPLCMSVAFPDFYDRWTEKEEEPFYEEVF